MPLNACAENEVTTKAINKTVNEVREKETIFLPHKIEKQEKLNSIIAQVFTLIYRHIEAAYLLDTFSRIMLKGLLEKSQ